MRALPTPLLNASLRQVDDPRFEDLDTGTLDRARTMQSVMYEIDPLRLRESVTLWRGSSLPADLLARGRWTDPAWVSCTFDADHARFAASSSPENQQGALCELRLMPGCHYVPLSYALAGDEQIANEHEVLITPGHKFIVRPPEAEVEHLVIEVRGLWEWMPNWTAR